MEPMDLYEEYNAAEDLGGTTQNSQWSQNVAKLEAQIAQIQERIARNKRALAAVSDDDVNNRLADLEMSKVGLRLGNRAGQQTDPTSFWRWNQQRIDTRNANERVKSDARKNFANTESMYLNQRLSDSKGGFEQQIRNLEGAIREGKNLGYDTSRLEGRLNEMYEVMANGGPGAFKTFNKIKEMFNDPNATSSEMESLVKSGLLNPEDVPQAMKMLNTKKDQERARSKKNKATNAGY